MARSLSRLFEERKDSDFSLSVVYGLKEIDRRVFRQLAGEGCGMKIDTLADSVDRDRSTVYRSVQRLTDAGVVEKKKVNYDSGGYYHLYVPEDPGKAAEDMREEVERCREQMEEMIRVFREKYSD
ncbi:MAG: helix-turn-helix domain-containing protein [Candidatus Nanohaloarchaea archaeon]